MHALRIALVLVGLLTASLGHGQLAEGLIEGLAAEDWETRQAAQTALMQLASNSVDHVLEACNRSLHESPDPEVRYRARQILVQTLGTLVFGTVKKGFLGVSLQQSFIEQRLEGRSIHTVDITRVLPDHQAIAHGITTGHRIAAVDDNWCTLQGFNMRKLIDYVAGCQPGHPLRLKLIEGGKIIEKTVPLGERPSNPGDLPIEIQRQQFVEQWLRQNAPAEEAATP